MSWLLLDIGELIRQRETDRSTVESTVAGAIAGSAAGATTTANIAGYAKPFKKMLRAAPFPFDQEDALDSIYGKKKKRK